MPQGFALTQATKADVVIAYACPSAHVESVVTTPGWTVIGEFLLPLDVDARLDAQGVQVSDAALTCRLRLYDRSNNTAVGGSLISTTSLTSVRVLSGIMILPGNRTYQIQAECTGAAADISKFAVVQTATLSD